MFCQLLLSCALLPSPSHAWLCLEYRRVHAALSAPGDRLLSTQAHTAWCAPLLPSMCQAGSLAALQWRQVSFASATALHFPRWTKIKKTLLVFSRGQSFQVLPQPDRIERAGPSGLRGKLEVLLDRAALEPRSLQLCTLLLCSPQLHWIQAAMPIQSSCLPTKAAEV